MIIVTSVLFHLKRGLPSLQGERWVSIPLPLSSQPSALPIELQSPFVREGSFEKPTHGHFTPLLYHSELLPLVCQMGFEPTIYALEER